MFKVGDRVECIITDGSLIVGEKYTVKKFITQNTYDLWLSDVIELNELSSSYYVTNFKLTKEKSMLDSVKEYLKENKQIIMTIAVVLIVDHLVFGGAFREKVKSLVDGLLSKAQKQLDKE